ncbi:uncharacterized protein BDW43DRAFT_276519 [Aspergillus alliaceus]|uniref:uncharacterized protein n=1 Tax=Petromyces alliaceus TaxID=209559 RepID=UPI0012A69F50|nr:uncharacterized protein BDW43DRAFT_276519 [Aspergillus alliaceus]KAB8233510.1 hypothetical protein BDW43DRAFT_276519 [Aspergillus alliaceus]
MLSVHHIAWSFLIIGLRSAQLPSAPSFTPDPSYTGCPPDGPLLPKPTNLAQSKHFRTATDNLPYAQTLY